jgi:hypothetical protein
MKLAEKNEKRRKKKMPEGGSHCTRDIAGAPPASEKSY